MATITYDATGVKVDTCAERHGIWLDKGKFEAIIAALEKEVEAKDVSDYVAASLQEAKEIFMGNEDLISDWKDFLTVTRLLQYRVLAENPKLSDMQVGLQRSNPLKLRGRQVLSL